MSEKYDVIIIGAGIGGLIAGCYLKNSGLKVLIIEQHYKAGGYCTSFERQGYKFDVAVHYFGGIKKGILNTVLNELKLTDKIKFNQFDPTDKIITPQRITYIRTSPKNTIRELIKNFPEEKLNIKAFFKFISEANLFDIYKSTNRLSFKSVLDNYFTDTALKTTFNSLIRNIGLCSNEASALSTIILLREYIMDPGYYPEGGTQKFAEIFLNKFIKLGGKINFMSTVNKIITDGHKVRGVGIKNKPNIMAKYIISNADANLTFKKLLDVNTPESRQINTLQISPSVFTVFLGLKPEYAKFIKKTHSIWPFLTHNLCKSPVLSKNEIISGKNLISLISFPSFHNKIYQDKPTIQLTALVPYESKTFWKQHRYSFSEKLIDEAEKSFPGLKKSIVIKNNATPVTFERYTSNIKGSGFGWKSTIPQMSATVFPSRTSIKGLYLTGHWCTMGTGQGGIPKVAFAGRRTACLVLNEMGIKNQLKEYKL